MASPVQPDLTQGGAAPAPEAGGAGAAPAASPGGPPPSAAPAPPEMMALAKLYQLCKQIAQTNPVIAPGLAKAAQGIQEAQSALMTQPQQQPAQANPPY